jgi:DNA repair photolyase
MSIIYEPKGRALEYSLLAANLFTGCTGGCTYCYARKMAAQYGKDFDNPAPKKNVLAELEKDARKYAGTDKRVLLCFSCDPYQPLDLQERITRSAITILKENDINFQILTKFGLNAVRDFDLYKTGDAFAVTLTYIEKDDSLRDEPGAAIPAERIEAIRQAHDRGIETWASLEPVLDAKQSLELIRITHEFTDLYKIGRLNHRPSQIDWRQFGIEALNLCREYGKPYYIKNDLASYLEGIQFQNVDTRRISIQSESRWKNESVQTKIQGQERQGMFNFPVVR